MIELKRTAQNNAESSRTLSLSFTYEADTCVILLVSTRSAFTTPTGYTLLKSENVPSFNQTLYFLTKKNATSGTESLVLQQASSARFYAIAFVVSGTDSVTYETGYNYTRTVYNDLNLTVSKQSANVVCIWGINCAYAEYDYHGEYTVTPNDVTVVNSAPTSDVGIRLVGIFDAGVQSHTIRQLMLDTRGMAIDAVVLNEAVIVENKYLIEDGNDLYTVESGSLVSVSGSLSASLFQTYGFNDLSDVGDLLITLNNPKVHAWNVEEQPTISASVDAIPNPQSIVTNNINLPMSEIYSVDEIIASYTGNPQIAVSVDDGSWMCYDDINEEWISAGNGGMSISATQAISEEIWETLFDGATTLKFRVVINNTTDTLSRFEVVFLTN